MFPAGVGSLYEHIIIAIDMNMMIFSLNTKIKDDKIGHFVLVEGGPGGKLFLGM